MNEHVSHPSRRNISMNVIPDNDHQIISSLTSNMEKPVVGRRAFLAAAACSALAVVNRRLHSKQKAVVDDILYLPAIRIAELIRTREISSLEVVKACLNRIEFVNPRIHAVCALAAERALREARRADEQLQNGNIKGPLHGVPMTIKDSFDTEGIISTAGTTGRRTFVPKQDATIVRRLRESGAILLGKTNTPEFTMSFDTRNLLFKYSLNPYNLSNSSERAMLAVNDMTC
jgi:amidase